MKIVSRAYLDAIVNSEGESQSISDFDLGAMFRIMTQNDKSFYFETKLTGTIDPSKMSLHQKMDYISSLEPGEFQILKGVVIHIFDQQKLNPVAVNLCNLMEAQVTDMIVPFYTRYILVDKITPVYRQTLNSLQSRALEAERAPGETGIRGQERML